MNQSINTDSKNSKEPQQKYRLGTVSIKILGGLNRFYRRLTSPSASIMAQNIQLFGPRGGFLTHQWIKASVPTDDLIPKNRHCRNQHSMTFQTPIANTDVYKGSFFPQTISDWNALPDSLISSAEDAEDGAAKFTSLVRARN